MRGSIIISDFILKKTQMLEEQMEQMCATLTPYPSKNREMK